MKYFVTGGAGFIGSTLVDRLIGDGHEVVAYDNFSTGLRRFLGLAQSHPRFRLVEGDLLDPRALSASMGGSEFVIHFAANADVRYGTQHPRRDLDQNVIATFNVLEAMREVGISRIAFSSTGSIYGEPNIFPTPETAPFPIQTSLYGASKLAGEGLIAAYCEGFGFRSWIFRFVSVLGERYTHGHVFDFFRALRADPTHLHILGDGRQRKSYIYVQDCIDAILLAIDQTDDKVNILNIGTDSYCEVNDSVGWICAELGLQPRRSYAGGKRGWIGDSPFIFLDARKICALGWKPRFSIEQSVRQTVRWLQANPWVYEQRH
jgi:UDP-glucose 4-epimerase